MSLLFLILSVILISAGQILQKKAAHSEGWLKNPGWHLLKSIVNHHFLFAMLCLSLGTIFWLMALPTTDLSIANPFQSLSYALVMIISKFMFGEEIPAKRWLGIFLIIIGIIIISQT